MSKIKVNNLDISIIQHVNEDFISLTDMLKSKDGEFFISDWLRNRNTLEYLSIWERIHNPDFNYGEFAIISSKSGLNNFKISVKEWTRRTNAIGIIAKTGRYGGTYAHKDIAFEFGMWISPEFKIYLVKEYQRLQEQEYKNLDWNIKRALTKINYRIHTDAIQQHLIPKQLTNKETAMVYANEADVLNMALFGKTAQQWRDENPDLSGNMRDYAHVNELICLSNLENINALYIQEGYAQKEPACRRHGD
jgi:hypothetical protein